MGVTKRWSVGGVSLFGCEAKGEGGVVCCLLLLH